MMIFWEDLKNLEEVSKVDNKLFYWNCFGFEINIQIIMLNPQVRLSSSKPTNHLPFNQTLALENPWKIHSLSSWVFIMTTLGLNEFLIKQPQFFTWKTFVILQSICHHIIQKRSKQNWPIERLPKPSGFRFCFACNLKIETVSCFQEVFFPLST